MEEEETTEEVAVRMLDAFGQALWKVFLISGLAVHNFMNRFDLLKRTPNDFASTLRRILQILEPVLP